MYAGPTLNANTKRSEHPETGPLQSDADAKEESVHIQSAPPLSILRDSTEYPTLSHHNVSYTSGLYADLDTRKLLSQGSSRSVDDKEISIVLSHSVLDVVSSANALKDAAKKFGVAL
jgi:hypothetical protein